MNVIVDYGIGNIKSLINWFEKGNLPIVLSHDPEVIRNADLVILPGVGAFKDGMQQLADTGLDKCIVEYAKNNKPLVGICLGMQLLFDRSYENGACEGLGLIEGEIVAFEGDYIIPHMGWNTLKGDGFYNGKDVYFVHSFYLSQMSSYVVASTDYYAEVPSVVKKNNILGFQFHPEKSGTFGESILRKIEEFKNEILSSN